MPTMSCQIKTVSTIGDCIAVKQFLYPRPIRANLDFKSGYSNDSLFARSEEHETAANGIESLLDQTWLQDCYVSLSPTADFLVLATADRILFLASKWDMHEESEIKSKFNVLWESYFEIGEEVTNVLCLPLASQKRSSQGGVDWTCVVVGLSNGYVKMYTENGVQLLAQMFHEGPVIKLNCNTCESIRHATITEQQEELVILYQQAVVTIDGFSLYQTLRACRNQVAKATASGTDMLTPPPLAYKKWGFQDQYRINDCQNLGAVSSNVFDHLQTASVLGGFNAVPRNTIPMSSLILSSGQNPYLAFYYAMEGSSPPLMSEVAIAVASKLKSYIFSAASGFLGMSNKTPVESQMPKPKIEPAAPLACRFALPDARRRGETLGVSPNKMLAVVTDSFGRVVLVDARLGIAVRMWKGYRDAQCGWLEVVEDTHRQDKEKITPVPRIATFLVIYAPRRGLLEVWSTQQGPRVAAFNVSKGARLLCPGYGLMGLSTVNNHRRKASVQCFLLDPQGPIKILSVPFHCALGDKNSKRAQSLHLLRKVKITLKESSGDSESFSAELTKMVLNIKTPSICQQAMEAITNNKRISYILLDNINAALLEQLQLQEFETMDFESKLLIQSCLRLNQLLLLFKACAEVNEAQAAAPMSSVINVDDFPVDTLSEILFISKTETEQIKGLLQRYQNIIKSKAVCFSDEKHLSPARFLSCFHIFIPHLDKNHSETCGTRNIELHPQVTKEQIEILGCFVFKSSLQNSAHSQDVEVALIRSGLMPAKIMAMLVEFCLSQISWLVSWDCLVNYSSTIKFITNLQDSSSVIVSCNEVSSWWQNVRSLLIHSNNSPLVYLCAVVCRGVALIMATSLVEKETKSEDEKEKDELTTDDEKTPQAEEPIRKGNDSVLTDWENISMDIMQWNILAKQAEDLMVLSCLLNYRVPKSNFEESYQFELSLNNLCEKGRGVVSELIGEWLIRSNLDARVLQFLANENDPNKEVENAKEAVEDVQLNNLSSPVDELLKMVQKRFPFSTHPEVIATNFSWEHAVRWSKEPDSVMHLQSAVNSLHIITNAILKHGIASMIWHMLVSKRFTNAALLTEKVGKPPKERLSRRDVGMSDTTLAKFIEISVELLDILMEANIACHGEVPPGFNYEDFWQNCQGPTPLVEVASSQKTTNYDLVCHHHQLALTIHMIITFNIRNYRPISMYDTKGKSAFFKELHMFPSMTLQDLDLSIVNMRTRFLCKVISSAVECIPEPIPDPNQSDVDSLPAIKAVSLKLSHWIGRAIKLGRIWGIDVDMLRRHYVCELYSSGLDSLAEEILPSINDTVVMGSQLILIAGQRLQSAVKKKFSSIDTFSMASPTLITWLKTLDQSTLRNLHPPLTMTATLISHVINHLPEGHVEYQMALSLVDAVHYLTDYSNETTRMLTNTG